MKIKEFQIGNPRNFAVNFQNFQKRNCHSHILHSIICQRQIEHQASLWLALRVGKSERQKGIEFCKENDFQQTIFQLQLAKMRCTLHTMAIRVVEFSNGDTKLERFLHKNQHTQRKFLNFENWTIEEPQQLAKIRVFKRGYKIRKIFA